jgi:hypothetical protein
MGDPELRSDEKVLVRTQGVYVKSIPFEGILTNKRIILIDRAKNLLPPKEIPLVTIKEVEAGENAIRDQIITLSVMAKTGETRQMILTFSRQAGGNRIKERDAWVRTIKENASSSFDQVIRKVIPGPEPAQRRVEPAAGPRYEVVHSPIQQQPAAPPREYRPSGTATDDMSPVRRPVTASPVTPVTPSPAVRQFDASSLGTSVFCSKCGNKVPSGSVFCNRCGSPVAQIPQVSSPVQTPPVPPAFRTTVTRPIDEEIQSIEPLIERSPARVPADALRAAPAESPLRPPLRWDDDEPKPVSLPETGARETKAAGKGFLPRLFSAKSSDAAGTVPSYAGTGDTPPPPRPPRSRSLMPGKQTILTAAAVLVAILIVAVGALVVYPMLTSGGLTLPLGDGNATPSTTPSSIAKLTGAPVVKETQAPDIPQEGVYVHVNYMGGFKGSYGISDAITTVPGNSGDRVWEVENATNSTVQATFEKLDGSSHELLVEIYHNGKALSSGTTTVGHGSVALSVDMVTGVAAAPVTSGGGTAKTTPAAAVTTLAGVATTSPAGNTTTIITTVTTTATTAMAANTTTAAP